MAASGRGTGEAGQPAIRAERLAGGPIISPATQPAAGPNIQGPSLIRAPAWIRRPLGRYYLYFADHKGDHIRLAYADDLSGPWTLHPPGSLRIQDSGFPSKPPPVDDEALRRAEALQRRSPAHRRLPHSVLDEFATPHIASPDVHVDSANRRIVMYFHGLEGFGFQRSRVALSRDGISFRARPEIIARPYLRAFRHEGTTYAIAMPGRTYRSADGLTDFAEGPVLFNSDMRHLAVLKRGDRLWVFWTQVGHAPERILVSTIDLSVPWAQWRESAAVEVLRPELAWEGADLPAVPSTRSVAYGPVNQLRDPAIFEEGGRVFLLYAVAGESGIAIAELHFDP